MTEPAPPLSPAARPLSTPAAIAVTGLTAAVVMVSGILIAERVAPPRRTEPLPPPPRPTVVVAEESAPVKAASAPVIAASEPPAASAKIAPPATSAPAAAASAPVIAASAPVIAASASAAPIASAPPPAGARPDAAHLPERRGYLLVSGPAEARVFIKGEEVGATNEALEVPCGLAFVRLGTRAEGAHAPTWIGPGQSVVVGCRAETRVEAGGPAHR